MTFDAVHTLLQHTHTRIASTSQLHENVLWTANGHPLFSTIWTKRYGIDVGR